jgi:hypothetical protein
LFAVLSTLPRWRREIAERRAIIAATVGYYARHQQGDLRRLARPVADCARLYSGEVRAAAASALLRSWRGVHRFSALLLVALVTLHISIAWYYGFVWALAD